MFQFNFRILLTFAFSFPTQTSVASQPPEYRWEVRGTSQEEPTEDRPWSVTFGSLTAAEKDLKETKFDYYNKNGLLFASPNKPLGLYIMKYVVVNGVMKPAADSIAFGDFVDADFRQEVFEIAQRLKIRPDDLMTVMAIETSKNMNGKMVPTFDPSIKNPGSSAVGLIQFMQATAKVLGTTTEKLAKLSAVEQLVYVEKYLKPYVGRMKDVEDVYLAVFYPKALGKNDDFVFPQGIYEPNKGLDKDGNGRLTKGEIATFVRQVLKRGKKAKPASTPLP